MTKRKPRDMTGTVRCLECGASVVHENGPGTPLILRHADDCSENPKNRENPS